MNDNETAAIKSLFEKDGLLASVYVTLVSLFALVGVVGNIIILFTLTYDTILNKHGRVFLINIAIADLCVTGLADPMCIAGVFLGESYFQTNRWFCSLIACMCLTACFCVFFNLTHLTINRYIFICHKSLYGKIYSRKSVITAAIACWIFSFLAEAPNFLGWGGHIFDRKSHQCIWNRVASSSYTFFVVVVLILTPFVGMGVCHFAIFRTIYKSKKNLSKYEGVLLTRQHNVWMESLKASKNLLVLYLVFLICWTPYTVVIAVDLVDQLSMETHLFVTLMAHVHSSTNVFVYYFFRQSFRRTLIRVCFSRNTVKPSNTRADRGSPRCTQSKKTATTSFDRKDARTTPRVP